MQDSVFNAGFMRFVHSLSHELYQNHNNVVYPDWRVSSLLFKGNNQFCYGTESDGNIWLKLFHPIPYENAEQFDYNNISKLTDNAVKCNEGVCEDYLTEAKKMNAIVPTISIYTYIKNYVKLLPHIQERIDNIYNKSFKNKLVIGVHVRLPQHDAMEEVNDKITTHIPHGITEYFNRIDNIIEKYNLPPNSYRIFLATDSDLAAKTFRKRFKNNLVQQENVYRLSCAAEEQAVRIIKNENNNKKLMKKLWHSEAHSVAKSSGKSSTKLAEEVLIDIYLLSKRDFFIGRNSNFSSIVSILNPFINTEYSIQHSFTKK